MAQLVQHWTEYNLKLLNKRNKLKTKDPQIVSVNNTNSWPSQKYSERTISTKIIQRKTQKHPFYVKKLKKTRIKIEKIQGNVKFQSTDRLIFQ